MKLFLSYIIFLPFACWSLEMHSQVLLNWPLRQSSNYHDPGYYFISNHVDHDPSSGLLDYFGLERTYDGHDGTDIAIYPYPWAKMEAEQVEVICAATGVLIGKGDGNFDQSCAWDGGTWNYVLIRHDDGSKAWYGHLKKNTVTLKAI